MQYSLPFSTDTLQKITSHIQTAKPKKVVLQYPKYLLSHSFTITSQLRKQYPQIQFYTLYDSNKKQCCTDIIGAKHINYDILIHFGYACFSQKYQDRHIYILPNIQEKIWEKCILPYIMNQQFIKDVIQNNIRLVLCDQSVYYYVMKIKEYIENIYNTNVHKINAKQQQQINNKQTKNQSKIEIARLPFDKKQNDRYFGFSYYCTNDKSQQQINILVIKPNIMQNQNKSNPTSQLLLQNLMLCKKSLKINKIFTLSPTITQQQQNNTQNNKQYIKQYTKQQNKRLMQRISQISQLQKYQTFGILISNPSTQFCQQQLSHLQQLLLSAKLKQHKNIKYFTFMMNNLNQCKLGNFPQIQVYIIVSCYNYSLYSVKDFYRLVVTPFDIQVAFGDNSTYEEYRFDLNMGKNKQNKSQNKQQNDNKQQNNMKQQNMNININQNSLAKQNRQIILQNAIQTLDYYKNREYKGLQFNEKKQVQKIKLGKIGTATGYKPI